MRITIHWIILALLNSYSSASVVIHIEGSQNRCNPASLKKPCNINVAEYENSSFSSYTCPDLDSALEYVTTTNIAKYDNSSVVHICLPPGHFILKKSWHLSVNFILTGYNGSNLPQSVIQCDYNNDMNASSVVTNAKNLMHMLIFKNVQFVKLRFVQFENCPQPIRIEQSDSVLIQNCGFKNFSEAVFDIYGCAQVIIANSNFINNSGTGGVLLPFRGNTGAVSIGYFQNQQTNPTVLVENCTYINNQATISKESLLASSHSALNGIYVGRGGAIGLLVYESSYNVTIAITNSKFVNNHASAFGGAIYVVTSGDNTQHVISIENSEFINNIAIVGGGIFSALFSSVHHNFPTTLVIENCYFGENKGRLGGAISVIPSQVEGNVVAIENCTFEKNEAFGIGGAITIAANSLFESLQGFPKYNISNW